MPCNAREQLLFAHLGHGQAPTAGSPASRHGVGLSPSASTVGEVGDVDEMATPPTVLKEAAVAVAASDISSAGSHAGIETAVTPGSRRQSRRDRDRRNDEDEQLDTAALFAMAPHVQALIEDKGLVHIQGNSSVVSHRRDVGISNRRFLFSILLRALLYFAWYIPHAL